MLDWIRAHGKYLIAGQGLSGWTLAASILAGTLLNVFVLLPVILLFIGIASSDISSVAWPAALRCLARERCRDTMASWCCSVSAARCSSVIC